MIKATNWESSNLYGTLEKIIVRRCASSGKIISMIQKTSSDPELEIISEFEKYFVTFYPNPDNDEGVESNVFDHIIACQIWSNKCLKNNNIFYSEPYFIENWHQYS